MDAIPVGAAKFKLMQCFPFRTNTDHTLTPLCAGAPATADRTLMTHTVYAVCNHINITQSIGVSPLTGTLLSRSVTPYLSVSISLSGF